MRGASARPLGATLLALSLLPAAASAGNDLASKARAFRAALLARHLSPEGLLLYRVDLRSIDADLERGTYPDLADTPMFTGLLAAGACQRAGSSAGPARRQALGDAERALDGLTLLMDVTGVPGLLARAARRAPPPEDTRGKWFSGAAGFEDWSWRGDTSMDQYAQGLIPALGECARWFPERTRALVVAAAEGLLANDMRLVDPDGVRTRYGNLSWRSGFGLNAQAQLAGWGVFAWAAELDTDPRWAEQRDRLRDHYRVVARARRTNVRVLGITNHSNDLMAWNLYRGLVPLARRTGDRGLADLRDGMYRARLRTRRDGNIYFTLCFCRLEPQECDAATFEQAREVLAAFPSEKRRGEPGPELRALPRRWLPGRKLERLARDPVPIALRPASSFEWKSNPYRVERPAAPHTEYTGLDYLLAYWLYEELVAARARPVTP